MRQDGFHSTGTLWWLWLMLAMVKYFEHPGADTVSCLLTWSAVKLTVEVTGSGRDVGGGWRQTTDVSWGDRQRPQCQIYWKTDYVRSSCQSRPLSCCSAAVLLQLPPVLLFSHPFLHFKVPLYCRQLLLITMSKSTLLGIQDGLDVLWITADSLYCGRCSSQKLMLCTL